MKDELVHRHTFNFSPKANGGESLLLTTDFFAWDRPGVHLVEPDKPGATFVNQELTLQSYSNSATFNLGALLMPEVLRRLADELDLARVQAQENAKDMVGS